MFRMLVHPSSGACDLLWINFMCCIALVRCVLVLRCGSAGWCGILMWAEALQCFSLFQLDSLILVSIYSAEEAIRHKVDNYEILKCVRKNKYVSV